MSIRAGEYLPIYITAFISLRKEQTVQLALTSSKEGSMEDQASFLPNLVVWWKHNQSYAMVFEGGVIASPETNRSLLRLGFISVDLYVRTNRTGRCRVILRGYRAVDVLLHTDSWGPAQANCQSLSHESLTLASSWALWLCGTLPCFTAYGEYDQVVGNATRNPEEI
ncbi:hypothetical protein BGZ60DRAFT_102830 [Tricladium varicosporioides]|nr:hypothetical protein BGZ60DRAFT_102830 [Hymenoscyphus varicosporioides]